MSSAQDFSNDDELLSQFLDYAHECVEEMRQTLDNQIADPSVDMLEDLYGGAHNLKGMSGSFGFTLLTDIAGLMCLYIKKKAGKTDLDLLNSQMKAIEVILEHRIAGDGGVKGTTLKERLEAKTSAAIDLS